jgi:hypothetical protein
VPWEEGLEVYKGEGVRVGVEDLGFSERGKMLVFGGEGDRGLFLSGCLDCCDVGRSG